MKKPISIEPNEKIKSSIKHEIIDVLTIDFTGDGKLDFICGVKLNNNVGAENQYYWYWLDSEYKVIKIKKQIPLDFDFYWFVNIDNDIEPEIFHAFGYPEGIDYAFYDQDLLNGEDKLMFFCNPVIIDSSQNNKKYWGYPWDIKDIMISRQYKHAKVLCSVDHDIIREEEITYPENQIVMPVIFFNGKSTRPNVKVGEVRNITWYDIKELEKLIMK